MNAEKLKVKNYKLKKFFNANMFEEKSVSLGCQDFSSWSMTLNFSNEWLFCLEIKIKKELTTRYRIKSDMTNVSDLITARCTVYRCRFYASIHQCIHASPFFNHLTVQLFLLFPQALSLDSSVLIRLAVLERSGRTAW